MAKTTRKENQIDADSLHEGVKKPEHAVMSALQREWGRLHSIFQQASEGMLLCDASGQLVLANKQVELLFGKRREALERMRIQELLPPLKGSGLSTEDILKHFAEVGDFFTGNSLKTRRYFRLRYHQISEEEQRFWVVYMNETTSLVKQTQLEAGRADMLLQVLQHSAEPFVLLDAGLSILAFNKSADSLVEQAMRAQLQQGHSMLDYAVDEVQKEQGWLLFREVLSGLVVDKDISFYVPEAGLTRYLRVHCRPFYDADGQVNGIYLGATDQSSSKRDQQARHHQEAFTEALIGGTSDLTIILDGQMQIRYISDGVAKVLGYQQGSLVGQAGLEFVDPRDQALWLHRLARIASREDGHTAFAFRARHADGSLRWMQLRGQNHYNRYPVNGLVLHLWDNTENKLTELERGHLMQLLRLTLSGLHTAYFRFQHDYSCLWEMMPQAFHTRLGGNQHHLLKLLEWFGKRATTLIRKLKEEKQIALELQGMPDNDSFWQLVMLYAPDVEGKPGYLISLTDLSAERLLLKRQKELKKLKEDHLQLIRFFDEKSTFQQTIAESLPFVYWAYEPISQKLRVLALGHETHLPAGVQEKRAFDPIQLVHPNDIQAFHMQAVDYKHADNSKAVIRLLEADGSYGEWLARKVAIDADGRHLGVWYRSGSTSGEEEVFETLQHTAEFLEEMGWGVILLGPRQKLLQVSKWAADWLDIPEGCLGGSIEEVPALRKTQFLSQLYQVDTGAGLSQFDFFHAPTGRWVFVWVQREAAHTALYMQLMKL
ncbi:MAG: PAS domain-containing protein [Bacteroidia bacterium]